MDTFHGNMEFELDDTGKCTKSHRIVFSACFWHKPERATDNGVETKNQDHISWSRIDEFSFPDMLLPSTLHAFEV